MPNATFSLCGSRATRAHAIDISRQIAGALMSRRFVFKVVTRSAWDAACREGAFAGSADDMRDGFIHLSLGTQLQGTLAKHFLHQNDLLLVQFEARDLGGELRWEPSRGGEEFPHLYKALPTALAIGIHALHVGDDGVPQLPEEFIAC